MIDKKLIPVKGLKKNPFQVSHFGMRYYFCADDTKENFLVFVYPEPWSFEKTPDETKNTEYISHDRGWNGCCDFLAFGAVRCTQGFLELCFQKHDASRQSDFLILKKSISSFFILSFTFNLRYFFTSCHISFTIHWYSISINKNRRRWLHMQRICGHWTSPRYLFLTLPNFR